MEIRIKNYEDYSITEEGIVFSYKYGKKKQLKLVPCTNNYLSVVLSNNGTQKRVLIHRIVAIHFIKNPNNCKEVNHKDGNILNNNIDNLEWVSPKMNMQHAVKNGLHKAAFGINAGLSKLNDEKVVELRTKYNTGKFTTRELAKEYNMNNSVIWNAIKGKTWKHIELLKQENEK